MKEELSKSDGKCIVKNSIFSEICENIFVLSKFVRHYGI